MRDTLFIQFYSSVRDRYTDLCNGFSDAHALCRQHGDFYWQEHTADPADWEDETIYHRRPLPIKRGRAFVSAVYVHHLYQAFIWARENPDVTFVVGGPVAAERGDRRGQWAPLYIDVRDPDAVPPNLTITGKSVEEWFGVANFSHPWVLTLPDDLPPDRAVYFSYTLDNGCFWRKCIYCNIALHARELFRRRERYDLEFSRLTHPGRKLVRLNTGSVSARHIRDLVPVLPRRDGFEYRLFMRPGRPETEALQTVAAALPGRLPEMMIGIGMEFPSERMLAFIQKGFVPQEMDDFLAVCRNHRIRINANVILGWGNLVDSDIGDLDRYLAAMPPGSLANVQVRWLYAHPRTAIHGQFEGEPINLGPFYLGFRTRVSREQAERNRQAADIIDGYAEAKGYRVEGMAKVRTYLEASLGG
jgi:hypothetical protein